MLILSVWQQQWLVSDRATDGSVSARVVVNAKTGACACLCVYFLCEAVQWGAGWPFGRCRGGNTVTVWQSGPQSSCNGWALSRWTPLLPLFALPSFPQPTCPLFHRDLSHGADHLCLCLSHCVWATLSCLLIFRRKVLYFFVFLKSCRRLYYEKGVGVLS